MVKVRFAPSPTGYLHIGGARTALFNWLYAKAQDGQFILRIEDTDQQRSKKEYEEEILESMKWLGLDWDELYYQSKRFDLYREYAEKLVAEGKAYRDGDAILLKMTKQQIKFYDVIRGEINFDTSNFIVLNDEGKPERGEDGEPRLKDEVLIKADGAPAYSFCCVVDDALMEITHVIRGEDHISNTPKQIMMYDALGFKAPKFAHLPLIMGADGGRLSKRTGAVAVTDYREKGFLPEALVNYLILLGWAPGNNQEVITLSAAIKKFSLKKVSKSAAVFSMTKLSWFNEEYIKSKEVKDLIELILPFLKSRRVPVEIMDRDWLEKVVTLYKKRFPTLVDFWERTEFFFVDDLVLSEEVKEKIQEAGFPKEFEMLKLKLESLENFVSNEIEHFYHEIVTENGLKISDLIHPIRLALTASSIGPGLFDIIELLGKEKTLKRLSQAYA